MKATRSGWMPDQVFATGEKYFWRARGLDVVSGVVGAYSETGTFTVAPIVEAMVNPIEWKAAARPQGGDVRIMAHAAGETEWGIVISDQ